MTTVDVAYGIRWNTIIRELVEKLFVEQWFANVSYTNFYEQCAPIYCSYTNQEENDLTFILGLYGGFTVALRFLISVFIRIALHIRNRFCRNIIRQNA